MTALGLEDVYGLIGRGEWDLAAARCHALLREGDRGAPVHHALGLCLCNAEAYEDAIEHLARAAQLEPACPAWARDAGAVYAKLDRWREAFEVMSGVAGDLDDAALVVLVTAAVQSERADELLRRLDPPAVERVCASVTGLCAYCKALVACKRSSEAEERLTDGFARWPDADDLHEALAQALDANGKPDEALEHWRTFADLSPDDTYAQIKQALALLERGRLEASRAPRNRAQELGLTDGVHHVACLYIMLSDPDETGSSMLPIARQPFDGVGRRAPRRASVQHAARARGSRLRIGYIGGRFHSTPSYYFTHPILSTHDRSAVEVFLYCSAPWNDDASPYYGDVAEHCRPVADLNDDEFRALLRSDRLDVVVHMPGHFCYNKLALLCDRVAPVQTSYPHFPASTGCPGIDYLITDRWTSPPGTETEYSERLCRVPTGYLAFAAPVDGPPVSASRRVGGSAPVFGIFQRLAKFNNRVWDAAAGVLARVPDSSLLIHNSDPELTRSNSPTTAMIACEFDQRGIDPARVQLRGPLPYEKHLEVAGSVDVVLDTFPYGGQTTTFESLWMGVPVVTLVRPSHAGRVSAGILARCGREAWAARSIDDYVHIAAELAEDVDRLVALRRQLRQEFVETGFPDGRILSRSLERIFEDLRDDA